MSFNQYLKEVLKEGIWKWQEEPGDTGVEAPHTETKWGALAMELAKKLGEETDPKSERFIWSPDDVSFIVHNYNKQGKKAKQDIEKFLGQKGKHHNGRIWYWDVDGSKVWLDVGSRFDDELPVEISVTSID